MKFLNRYFLASALFFALFALSSLSKDHPFNLGDSAPLVDREMEDVSGKKMTLDGLKKEKGLLVIFSCNTCPFVVGSKSFPGWEQQYNEINAFANRYGIGMVLVNANEAKRDGDDSMAKMKDHAKKMKYEMPYVVDVNSELANALGAKTTPHVYYFDGNMKLVYMGAIDNSWDPTRTEDTHYLMNAIQQVSKGLDLKLTATAPKGCSIKRL